MLVHRTPTNVASPPCVALILEHDLDTREMYAEWLEYSGFSVIEANTADEALVEARSSAPNVITIVGGKEGCDLCVALKQDERTQAIPVVVVTAWAMGGHVERARLAGCDSVLVKPVLPSVLLDEINRLLEPRKPGQRTARRIDSTRVESRPPHRRGSRS